MRALLACLFVLLLMLCFAAPSEARWKKHGHGHLGYYPAAQPQGAWLPWLLPYIPPLLDRFVFPRLPFPPAERPPAEPIPEPIVIDPAVKADADRVYGQVRDATERFNRAFEKYRVETPEQTNGKLPLIPAPFGAR